MSNSLRSIMSECEGHRFGQAGYDITLDHIHDCAAVALDELKRLRSALAVVSEGKIEAAARAMAAHSREVAAMPPLRRASLARVALAASREVLRAKEKT